MSSISLAAYLDPGTGSVILQAILGGVAALAVTGKLWWHRVTSIFRRNSDRDASPDAESAGSDPAQS